MSVLDAVPLSGGKTLRVEVHRTNDLEACHIFTPPREPHASSDVSAGPITQRSCVVYAQGPVGGLLMARLGPVCINPS